MMLVRLETNFHVFWCPGEWLEIWWLFNVILGSPRSCEPSWRTLNGSPGPSNNYSRIPETRDPETETGNLETGKRVHGIHDTLEKELQMIPRSLAAPSREPADWEIRWQSYRIWGSIPVNGHFRNSRFLSPNRSVIIDSHSELINEVICGCNQLVDELINVFSEHACCVCCDFESFRYGLGATRELRK